jgi:peptidoglycan/xylan/chitin deacetylase (PgdA/CDA1 family)
VLAVALTDPPPTAGSPPSSATPAARTPAAQPDARRLAAPAVLLDADGVQRRVDDGVALTFDDGPDPRWTPVVLDLLRQHHARATFCVVGQHVAEHPELVRRIAAEGHVLCNHTWTHDEAMELRPPAAVRDEIGRTSKVIARAAGAR